MALLKRATPTTAMGAYSGTKIVFNPPVLVSLVYLLLFDANFLFTLPPNIIDIHCNTPRPRGPELSSQLRSIITELKDIGWSYRTIAAKHHIPLSTVKNTILRARKQATTSTSTSTSLHTSLPRSGRARVISEEEERDEIYDVIAHQTPSISHTKSRR